MFARGNMCLYGYCLVSLCDTKRLQFVTECKLARTYRESEQCRASCGVIVSLFAACCYTSITEGVTMHWLEAECLLLPVLSFRLCTQLLTLFTYSRHSSPSCTPTPKVAANITAISEKSGIQLTSVRLTHACPQL